MAVKTVKFGGTSLCNAENFTKVKNIILADKARKYVVPSAPGKRFPGDEKITDLLYLCYAKNSNGLSFDDTYEQIHRTLRQHRTGAGLKDQHRAGTLSDQEKHPHRRPARTISQAVGNT